MVNQKFLVEIKSGVGITEDMIERAIRFVCMDYGYLDFADIDSVKVEEISEQEGER